MALIGIDLGTTNSLVTAYQDGKIVPIPNALGRAMTKSAISFLDDGTLLVGEAARERLVSHPQESVAYFKQFMGTEREFALQGKVFKAHDLSAMVLKTLKEDAQRFLGEDVDEAIISVPAYFNDNQRSATKLAASLAGMKANRLINEPSAAALYHRHVHGIEEAKLLVIDFGGGTLDVSVVDCFEEMVEILAISGDNHLGGKDIDCAIADYVCQQSGVEFTTLTTTQKESLLRSGEAAKIALMHSEQSWVCLGQESVALDHAILAKLCAPLFQRVKEVLVQAVQLSKVAIEEITDIVLVGGTAQLAVFADFLEGVFGVRPQASAQAEEMVALGLGLCCGIKERTIQDVFMTDVCPFSLGVGVYNRQNPERSLTSVLISRCSVLPGSVTKTYYTVYDGQSQIQCTIYQGENMYLDENLQLGEFKISVPPAPMGHSSVVLTFTYTVDGILQVQAEASGGDRRERLIVNPMLHLSEAELQERLEQMEILRTTLAGQGQEMLLLATLERLYIDSVGQERERAKELYMDLLQSNDQDGYIAHKKRLEFFRQEIAKLEERLHPSLWMGLDDTQDQEEQP